MKVLGVSLLNQLICACVLIVAYSATLIKVYRGSHYQIVTKITILLLVSNVGTIINVFFGY